MSTMANPTNTSIKSRFFAFAIALCNTSVETVWDNLVTLTAATSANPAKTINNITFNNIKLPVNDPNNFERLKYPVAYVWYNPVISIRPLASSDILADRLVKGLKIDTDSGTNLFSKEGKTINSIAKTAPNHVIALKTWSQIEKYRTNSTNPFSIPVPMINCVKLVFYINYNCLGKPLILSSGI